MNIIQSNCATITLDGSEIGIKFEGNYRYIWVENNSGSEIKISRSPNINDQEDGYVTRPSGGSFGMEVSNSTIYILGNGLTNVIGTNSDSNPFKVAGKGGGTTCTQHITEGLQMRFCPDIYRSYWTSYDEPYYIKVPFPVTVEFCGYYTNIPSNTGNGRWLEFNGEILNTLIIGQYGNHIDIASHGSWISAYPEQASIEENEKVTISLIYYQQSLKVYKNGLLVILRDNLNSDYDSLYYHNINFLGAQIDDRSLVGNLKDVRIYDRELTEDEILQNVTADKQLYFKEV